jgi:prepilin-type N-terminal cleavage/methylation domain-containing protein
MKKLTYNEYGFSLLEVSLAVGIMAILTAMAMPTFSGMIPKVKAQASSANAQTCAVGNQLNSLAALSSGVPASAASC